MNKREPHAFIIFTIVVSVIALVVTAAVILSKNNVDTKYAKILVFFLLLTFALTAVGIYAGKIYKTEEKKFKRQNNIGFVGNIVIFLTMIILMICATLFK